MLEVHGFRVATLNRFPAVLMIWNSYLANLLPPVPIFGLWSALDCSLYSMGSW